MEVQGRQKQGTAFGYTKVRRYHPQLATCAQTGQVLMSRLRGGSAGAARGAASFLTETVSRVRNAGATGQLTVRADSAFYSKAVLATAAKFNVRFSVTARQDKLSAPRSTPSARLRGSRSRTGCPPRRSPAPTSPRPLSRSSPTTSDTPAECAWSSRRVRPTPGSQLALFTTWDYHAFVTDRDLPLPEVEADHRRHAIVEQSIAELKSAGLAHLRSGRFMANAAWLALAGMAHNLGRAIGQLAGHDLERATAATLRRAVFTVPGRLVNSGRRLHLRLPHSWPWTERITAALNTITAIPLRC